MASTTSAAEVSLAPSEEAVNHHDEDDSADDVDNNNGGIVDINDRSLIIPIKSSSSNKQGLFVEIFPEEIVETSSSTLVQVLKDEQSDPNVWCETSLMYMQQQKCRESLAVLKEACETLPIMTDNGGISTGGSSSSTTQQQNQDDRVRILASTGIAHLASQMQNHQKSSSSNAGNSKRGVGGSGGSERDDADRLFTQASKVDTFFPMTWIGRGMLNLSVGRLDQAKFFFQTTLLQCGEVMPALLGMAAVLFGEKDYKGSQAKYAETIRRYPTLSGAPARVGFGFTCYKLGQVDRAKAAFTRALQIDPECVNAMVGSALLEMASLDETSKDFGSRTEKAIKMMSMANLLDHSNAMVQNHLANHYFWKWTPVVASGTVSVTRDSTLIKGSQPIPLEPGERIRIGPQFETTVADDVNNNDDDDDDDGSTQFRVQDPWKDDDATGLKVWKKDYDRVVTLAKGAYGSTSVEQIQAESLFFLARVYHVREETETALKFYEKACKLAPDLAPARFGLAQTLVVKGEYGQAMSHLSKLVSASSTLTSQPATDALALLGLLEVRAGGNKKFDEGLAHLRKAIELDPLNPELLVLEALALQQHKATYQQSLQRYEKAIDLLKRKGEKVSYDIYANGGVLCHETKKYEEALSMFKLALEALDSNGTLGIATLDCVGVDGGLIRHEDNGMFCGFVDSEIKMEPNTENKKLLKIESPLDVVIDVAALPIKVGDRIRLNDDFQSDVVNVESKDDGRVAMIEIKDEFEMPTDENSPQYEQSSVLSLFVMRENRILTVPEAVTVAFNIARLHETTGRTLAAIELHKAILKRNPGYVNSSLRLACIAVDCGCLKECSEWLKIAAHSAPGNPEVLTLIGNLHLSLCDWKAAHPVFEGLLVKKIPNVEAYASLSLGNMYFANLQVSDRYAKNLQYASSYYAGILKKDPANTYAANGLGTVLAEKGEIFKAKEAFNRVREVSGDSIPDALLNLGHIYLASKKHPEALQMYQNYMKQVEGGTTPITSKSRVEDVVDVLLYIAFAYFDWARHTELFNDANAAPADGRYKKAIEHLEQAISKHSKKEVVLKYNLCMTKLQAANCVLQKLTRNIPRTLEEVQEALTGLQGSLTVVEQLIEDKNENKKVPISTSVLQQFVRLCRQNISSAESHLEDEKRRAKEAEEENEMRRKAAEAEMKEEALREMIRKADEAKKQEERDRKAEAAMRKVEQLRANWQQEQAAQDAAKDKKAKKPKAQDNDFIVEDDNDNDNDNEGPSARETLFDSDSDDDQGASDQKKDDEDVKGDGQKPATTLKDIFGDSDDDDDDKEDGEAGESEPPKKMAKPSSSGLFDESDDDDDAGAGTTAVRQEKGVLEDSDKEDGDVRPSIATKGGTDAADDGKTKETTSSKELFDDSESDSDEGKMSGKVSSKNADAGEAKEAATSKDLFDDSDSESDEELIRPDKRQRDDAEDQPLKKRRVLDEE